MFDATASRYDLVNDILSLGQDRAWRRATVSAVAPKPGQVILDLAAGTGTSSAPYAASGAVVVAADLSYGMLEVGKRRLGELFLVNADALALPFAAETFDAVTISFGLRNVVDTAAALIELRRVTKVGGRIVICEFATPTLSVLRFAYHQYLRHVLPNLAQVVSSNPAAYEYLSESILAWPDQEQLAGLLKRTGWKTVSWKNLSAGIVALHRGYA